MQFCAVNQSLSEPWQNGGLNQCLTYLISSCIVSLFILPLAIKSLLISRHQSFEPENARVKSTVWYIQLVLCILTSTVTVLLPLLFELIPHGSGAFSGYLLLQTSVYLLAWILAIVNMYMEHKYAPSGHHRTGHGYLLLSFWISVLILSFLPIVSVKSPDWWWRVGSALDIFCVCLWVLQILLLFCIIGFGIRTPSNQRDTYARLDSTNARDGRWARRFRRLKLILPYIWPHGDFCIQLRVVFCIVILILERVINLYSPVLYKQIVDSLTVNQTQNIPEQTLLTYVNQHEGWLHRIVDRLVGENGLLYRWDYVLLFIAVRFLQGLGGFGGGLLDAIHSQLWIAVDQFSTRELSIRLFSHLHNLSLQWHLSRKTGEMLRIMDRGTASISNVLSYVVFNILPTIVDIIVGVVYFVAIFNVWYGLLLFATMTIYMVVTILITEKRAKYRRDMNTLDNQKSTKAVDALLNFETVKYFNAEKFETQRFREAFLEYQKAGWWTTTSLNLLNTAQNATIIIGLLIGTLLCARDVVEGRLTVGDFVLFYTYMLQLYAPLGFFGTYYRLLQTSMIDMENMFDLLEEYANVVDLPGARSLRVVGGEIEFRDVCFHYSEERPILKNISFRVPPGRSVALVGQSGAGKSTIVRLLFRFYDVTHGQILIDGQDISQVTQSSLREAIGVVPQDTVLFNETIHYNIKYGRQTASATEVEQAARSADIHDRILEFPQGYETIVGERGLKLSGGEKQRVALARNMLKDPQILLLDEATSALDTATERNIQSSLNKISQSRTTLIVAHRLSTIVGVDEILMMHQGEIVERGTHAQLLAIPDGRYAALWRAQVEAHQADTSDAEPKNATVSG